MDISLLHLHEMSPIMMLLQLIKITGRCKFKVEEINRGTLQFSIKNYLNIKITEKKTHLLKLLLKLRKLIAL